MSRAETFTGVSITTLRQGRILPYHPRSGAPGRATWSAGHFSEVSEATAPEAYVPRMMGQEYTPEDDPG